jgi:phosphatidylinositol alpha-mannosyltransferase
MKIGIICPYDITKGGGVQEIVKAQAKELGHRGHEVFIITPRPQGYEVAPEQRILFVGNAADLRSPGRTTIQVSAGLNDDIHALLEKHNFDILHFHEPWMPMLSLQILSRSKAVNVATFHAKLPETAMIRTMARIVTPYSKSVLKYIDAFTAVSDEAAEYICSLTDEPVAIIPNGIDMQRFKPPRSFPDNRKAKTIFYVGRLEGRKGVNYLLRAFKILSEKHPELSLVIGGDGVDRAKLEMLADDLELRNVQFLGYVPEADKEKYFRSSDLYCSPALFGESFGVVLLEAMASGLVTVAGDNPGYATVMKGLGALSLVNPKHVSEFARRMELLLYEKDLRHLWRSWALEEIKQYDYPNVVTQYEEVYADALERLSAEV